MGSKASSSKGERESCEHSKNTLRVKKFSFKVANLGRRNEFGKGAKEVG